MPRDDNNLYYDSVTGENGATSTRVDTESATPTDVARGYGYAHAQTGEIMFGEAEAIPFKRMNIEPGEKIKLNPGFYEEGVEIIATSIDDFTYGTARPGDIAKNKTAWVGGRRLVGTGKIFNSDLISTATPEDVLEGKSAFNSDAEYFVGTIPKNIDYTVDIAKLYGESNTLPKKKVSVPSLFPTGYYDGVSAIIPNLADTTATAEDIALGKSAIVNNSKVLGSLDIEAKISARANDVVTARPEDVLTGKTTYVRNGDTVQPAIGTMPNATNITPAIVSNTNQTYTIPKGFHDGTGKVNFQLVKTINSLSVKEASESSVLNGTYFFNQNGECKQGGVLLSSWNPVFLRRNIEGFTFNGRNDKINLSFSDDPTPNRVISFVNRSTKDSAKEFVPIYTEEIERAGDFANTVLAIPTPLRQFAHINHYNAQYNGESVSSLKNTQYSVYVPSAGGYFGTYKYNIHDDYYTPWFSKNIQIQKENLVIDKITVKFYNNSSKSADSLIYKITFPYLPRTAEDTNLTEYHFKCRSACNVDYDGISYNNSHDIYEQFNYKIYAVCGAPREVRMEPGLGVSFTGGNFPITFHVSGANGEINYEQHDLFKYSPYAEQLWDSQYKTYIDIEFHDIHVLNRQF